MLVGGALFVGLSTRSVVRGVRAMEESLAQERARALVDPLTQLSLRPRLEQLLADTMAQAKDGSRVVVLCLCVHDLAKIGRTFGHRVADALVVQIAARLNDAGRGLAHVGHLGGGTFVVVFSDEIDEESFTLKICQSVGKPLLVEQQPFSVMPVVGIARYPEHGQEASTLVRQAEAAAELAKELPGGRAIYDGRRDREVGEALRMAGRLRAALSQPEGLQVWYQPQVHLASGKVIGFEALARWPDPRGDVSPSQFIPIAEQAGIIGQLTYYVMDKALRDLSRWLRLGQRIQMSVNISTLCFADDRFASHLLRLLNHWGVPARHLMLEITETSGAPLGPAVTDVVQELLQTGVQFSIDDFGTGYCSFDYLKRFPSHALKLDRSFVGNLPDSYWDTAIVAATISLAHETGRIVVAEGVESQEVLEALIQLGCDAAQGFYLSHPLPAGALEQVLGDPGSEEPVGEATVVPPPTVILPPESRSGEEPARTLGESFTATRQAV
jgi:diguanylate cyclase (GGDEF)-like protein